MYPCEQQYGTSWVRHLLTDNVSATANHWTSLQGDGQHGEGAPMADLSIRMTVIHHSARVIALWATKVHSVIVQTSQCFRPIVVETR